MKGTGKVLPDNKIERYIAGVKAGTGIGIAYIPFGVTIGLISKNFGQMLALTGLTSFGMYAGGAHSFLLKILYVLKSPPFEIIVSIMLINLRYLLLNIVVFRQMRKGTTILQKMLVGVGLTDETITYIVIKKADDPHYMMGVNTVPYLCYCLGSIFGALFGEILPSSLMISMNFVLYAIFFSMLVTSLNQNFKNIRIVLIALAIRLTFAYAPVLNKVSSGWVMILTMFFASLIYAQLFHNERSVEESLAEDSLSENILNGTEGSDTDEL